MNGPKALASKTIAEIGEFDLLDVIKHIVPTGGSNVLLGIGDDAAAFRPGEGMLVLATCDIQVEGRHFRLDRIAPRQLGRRSASINLSDIGAMGGTPTYALVSLALPRTTTVSWVQELYYGFREAMDPFDAVVIGGNLSSSVNGVVVDINLFGEVGEDKVLSRDGARPGDAVLITGMLGSSTIGRLALDTGLDLERIEVAKLVSSHLNPRARVREGIAVASLKAATAMIDVSDGLAGDLGHICGASQVGARLYVDRLPTDEGAKSVAEEVGADLHKAVLHGGEDYELIVTCPIERIKAISDAVLLSGTPITEVGEIVEDPGINLIWPDGHESSVKAAGWDHFNIGLGDRG